MNEQKDWSIRHSCIRWWLVLSAAIIFACSRSNLVSDVAPFVSRLHYAPPSKEAVAFAATFVFLYFFLRFWVRTSVEKSSVLGSLKRLRKLLNQIEQNRNRTTGLLRQASGALLAERLAAWDDALATVRVTSSPDDAAVFAVLRAKLDLLDALVQKLDSVLERLEPKHGPVERQGKQSPDITLQTLRPVLDAMNEIGTRLERRAQSFASAITASRDAIRDAKEVFSNQSGKGAEDINTKLDSAVGELQSMSRQLLLHSRAYYMDRLVFAVRLPQIFSIALVVASGDVIVAGAVQTAQRAIEVIGQAWTA